MGGFSRAPVGASEKAGEGMGDSWEVALPGTFRDGNVGISGVQLDAWVGLICAV
jgi:hypothetical protein